MIEQLPISMLKLNDNNPRFIKDEKFQKLVKSIKEFPEMLQLRPIVVNDNYIVLGGNMRLRACKEAGLKQVPIIKASSLTEAQQNEFMIKDNVGFGEWSWDDLANNFDTELLTDWGMDIVGFDVDADKFGEGFSLAEGDKPPFQQMTFTLADEQATVIKNAMEDIKQTDEYKFGEFFNNENSNGNALALIVQQWAEQRK
jgi:hypothetical protein